jgi:DNA adenine methylase
MSINSPFRYAGGKYYARSQILEHLPYHEHYIEPFCGGASIFFAKEKVKVNHLNDKDSDLINTLKHIRDTPDGLIDALKVKNFRDKSISNLIEEHEDEEIMPALKKLHTYFKNDYKPSNDLERALKWFYLNRTSYSGIMNKQNMYWGYGAKYSMQPKYWPRNIIRTSKKLDGVELTSRDFEDIIDNAPDDSFLFVDPPYYNADQDKFYRCIFEESDHTRLLECLQRNSNRLKFLLTYDNTEEIKEMYQWTNEIYDKEWNYCIERTDDQKNNTDRKGSRSKGKEVFILNYGEEAYLGDKKQLQINQ